MVLLKKFYSVVVLTIFFLNTASIKAQTLEQTLKIELRSIGHEFLMQLNDSTSRILPIEKEGERYALQFEHEFAFEPDFLIRSTYQVIERSSNKKSFLVEVEKCNSSELVHSFEASLTKNKNAIACKERALPKACYIFYFTPSSSIIEENTTANDRLPTWLLLLLALLLIISIVYFIKRARNTKTESSIINIGQYNYDPKGMTLSLKTELIELSSKESDLLFLLFSNESKTLGRDFILKEVWGNDGDYIGRTLDVFISKLRKKLAADSSIKIINARGVGYRFVME